MKYLLDSDVLAAAIKGRLPVVLKLAELRPGDVAVSVFSRVDAETALRLQPRAQVRYGKLLKEFLATVPVLDFGAAEAQQAVQTGVYLQAASEKLAPMDLWLAATALTRKLVLVTERVNVFASVPNLEVERWA
ncbi:tRNA(fMet)-specific endonuclease VapC [Solimonas aquatica]|uniref:tRNA(fMet)-specific endonuclease VapC n=1 Tax=Solimonas aquatica TaxID=489703 RepID=A0A1H8ZW19_9GAMM|nr:type II toxin-antitoxin system VapC family toxin [Solimonas aquatica]SEP68535.1 tRNA(fMet)-specific endonuclease VapC [Solimonas aquatica]